MKIYDNYIYQGSYLTTAKVRDVNYTCHYYVPQTKFGNLLFLLCFLLLLLL